MQELTNTVKIVDVSVTLKCLLQKMWGVCVCVSNFVIYFCQDMDMVVRVYITVWYSVY